MRTLLVLILTCITSISHAASLQKGYAVSSGTTLWNASGSDANNGIASIFPSTSGTASCGSLSTVTQSQIDNSSFPGTAVTTMPGSGTFFKATMSGGASGGDCILDIDVTDFAPGTTLLGQFFFFAPGYNNNTNGLSIKMQTSGGANRLVFAANLSTTYVRRQEGWNLLQAYCTAGLSAPDWNVEAGTPTCATTFGIWTIRATIAANTTITMYFGDVLKSYYAKPQIIVWSADGDNTAKTVMEPYMTARGMKGSYAPTIAEINQGANPMSLSNLLALCVTAGWSCHPHQSTSVIGDYTLLSGDQLSTELALVKSLFASNGVPMSKFYYPPGGACTLAVAAAMVKAGFSGLGCTGNVSADQNGRPIYGGLITWNGHWNVSAESVNLAANMALIDHAIKYGETIDLLWHKVDGTVTCNVACFQAVIDYLYVRQQAGVLDVVTWDQLVSRQVTPRRSRN